MIGLQLPLTPFDLTVPKLSKFIRPMELQSLKFIEVLHGASHLKYDRFCQVSFPLRSHSLCRYGLSYLSWDSPAECSTNIFKVSPSLQSSTVKGLNPIISHHLCNFSPAVSQYPSVSAETQINKCQSAMNFRRRIVGWMSPADSGDRTHAGEILQENYIRKHFADRGGGEP